MSSRLSAYSIPIMSAVVLYPVIVCILALPFLIWNYRKYKGLSAMRATVIFSFVFYMMCAFFLTLLPLPTVEEVLQRKPVEFNYHLFNNIIYVFKHSGMSLSNPGSIVSLSNWKKFFTSFMFFQIVANIVMQVPLGFYLRYYFRVSWKWALLIGFLVSGFYELTQFTGVWGIYPYAFRCPDVDDLMNNTLGCMIGFAAAPILIHFLPSVEQMDEIAAKRGEKMGVIRAFTAFSVDRLFVDLILIGGNYIVGQFIDEFKYYEFQLMLLVNVLILALYFYIIPKIFHFQTLGNSLVKVKIVNNANGSTKLNLRTLVSRYLTMFFLEPMAVFASFVLIVNTAYSYVSSQATSLERSVFTIACCIYFPVLLIILLNSIVKRGGLPHDTITKTHFELDR